MKDYLNALNDYNRAIQIDPTRVEFYSKRGTTYFKMQKFSKALVDYDHVI